MPRVAVTCAANVFINLAKTAGRQLPMHRGVRHCTGLRGVRNDFRLEIVVLRMRHGKIGVPRVQRSTIFTRLMRMCNIIDHGIKNLVRVITYPEPSSRKCPLCDTENLEEPTLVEHVITYHTKSDTPWSSLLETLCAMDHHCFSHVLCLLHTHCMEKHVYSVLAKKTD